jgi:hypothetical protein
MHKYRFATGLLGLSLFAAAACASKSTAGLADDAPGEQGSSELANTSGAAGGTSGTDALDLPGSITVDPAGVLVCGTEPCQCNNGVDDDGDGTTDGFDVECTGAIDDDEGTFATGIPGDNVDPKWQDCFFDGNSGAGDDRCRYPTECLTGELGPDDEDCATTQACRDNCQPLTPNGCDCFGCCAVQLPGGPQLNVIIGASCSVEKLGDTEACPRCTPSATCGNECGECELCLGQAAADLPASCTPPEPDPVEPNEPDPIEPPPAPTPTCDGLQACSVSADCESQEFCSLGCCLSIIR